MPRLILAFCPQHLLLAGHFLAYRFRPAFVNEPHFTPFLRVRNMGLVE
jgi:hypothetical protein